MIHTGYNTTLYTQSHSISEAQDENMFDTASLGSSTNFTELHAQYERRIYATIIAITRNKEDAEDALQDTFLRAYLAIDRFEGRSSIYSWLTRIAINSALMLLRKRGSRREFSLNLSDEHQEETPTFELQDTSADPEQSYQRKQQQIGLHKAIQRLKLPLRVVVEDQITQEGSVKETARRLNLSETAVKSRLYRARTRLGAAYRRHTLAAQSPCTRSKKTAA